MRGICVLLALGACSFDASEDATWRGTIQRDGGPPLAFAGFDPYPAQGGEFGGWIAAMGYIDDGSTKFLVEAILQFTSRHDFENARSQAFPITLAITEDSNEPGMGVDFIEQPASDSDGSRYAQTFHHQFAQHQTGTVSGTFTVTACDYTSFMDGHLSATVIDPSRGNATRILDLQIHYRGDKYGI